MSIRTKFKRWLFQDMPLSATWDEWQDWKDKARKKHDVVEKEYEDEDTRMMKRLIDVRKALWT